MNDVLARIRVKEEHGIRRFLYPLLASFNLPENTDADTLSLISLDGIPVPAEVTFVAPYYAATDGRKTFQIVFAVSLAPHSEIDLLLICRNTTSIKLDDPLSIKRTADGGLVNTQQRLSIALSGNGTIEDVIYDGIPHLRTPDQILLNGEAVPHGQPLSTGGNSLTASCFSTGTYLQQDRPNVGDFASSTTITACKSWAQRYHWIQYPKSGDTIVFALSFAAVSSTLTCDFGVAGGVYGKLQAGVTDKVTWQTEFLKDGTVSWSISTDERIDYQGTVATKEEYHAQQWFHLVDKGKAIAVAIEHFANESRLMTVDLTHTGEIAITFSLADVVTEPEWSTKPASFSICYHFLNDIPAIAAATNPQSILLRPTVEVLPA